MAGCLRSRCLSREAAADITEASELLKVIPDLHAPCRGGRVSADPPLLAGEKISTLEWEIQTGVDYVLDSSPFRSVLPDLLVRLKGSAVLPLFCSAGERTLCCW